MDLKHGLPKTFNAEMKKDLVSCLCLRCLVESNNDIIDAEMRWNKFLPPPCNLSEANSFRNSVTVSAQNPNPSFMAEKDCNSTERKCTQRRFKRYHYIYVSCIFVISCSFEQETIRLKRHPTASSCKEIGARSTAARILYLHKCSATPT